MKKSNSQLKHGIHNEQVCDHLLLHGDGFCDWVITTAFYSALHLVSYKIFPYAKKYGQTQTQSINNLDDAYNHDNALKIDKHNLLADLVFRHYPKVADSYSWLLDTCKTARYKEYRQDPLIAKRAKTLLLKIKNECITKEDLATV